MSLALGDFQPINTWQSDAAGEKYNCCLAHRGQPKFIIDETTHRRYSNEDPVIIGIKCSLLSLATPFVHPIASIINVAYRISKLATLSHFRLEKHGETLYKFNKARFAAAGKDLLRIVATPLSLVGLEFAALYGIFNPYDGRKLYASIEKATYGNSILAPCFQPDPQYHALGGNINKKNAF